MKVVVCIARFVAGLLVGKTNKEAFRLRISERLLIIPYSFRDAICALKNVGFY